MRKTVIVTLQIEGLHCWKDCPIEEVSFLREPHRHIFHIRCERTVAHLDRDVEIICLKRDIEEWFFKQYYVPQLRIHNFGTKSCEMLALELVSEFKLLTCQVLEDNENGASIDARPQPFI